MMVLRKKRRRRSNSKEGPGFREVLSIFLILVGIFLLLSIFSYDPRDEANLNISLSDIPGIISGDENIRVKLERTHNWLGLLGAEISYLLLNHMLGYSSIIFGILFIIWGIALLVNRVGKNLLRWSLYMFIFALLISIFLGDMKLLFGTDEFRTEICGNVGLYSADVLIKLFGNVGSVIIILVLILISIGMVVEIDLSGVSNAIQSFLTGIESTVLSTWRSFSARRRGRNVMDMRHNVDDRLKKRERKVISEDIEIQPSEVTYTDDKVEVEEVRKCDMDFKLPPVELLDEPDDELFANEDELKMNAELLKSKLANFDIEIEKISVTPGPVVTLYEIVPAADVKISKIVSLADDIALALSARGIRVIAPIPGKGAVGVEIPNHKPTIVKIRSVIDSPEFKNFDGVLPVAMGKTITGEVYCDDLARMPHLLIGGATGSGKSVGINTLIASLLYKFTPSEIKFVIIDPKKIELVNYKKLVNHYLAICPDVDEEIITTPQNAVILLKSLVLEMERRYDMLAKAGVRNIQDYNRKIEQGELKSTDEFEHFKLPYIVIFIDELADLMLTAGIEVEEGIARLAQLARAVGIHLVVATQRPSVDVITGLIKANFSARIAYQVASKVDSRTILDMNGAEQLMGSGDMLYLPAGSSKPIRIQNAYISTEEVERIVNYIASQPGYDRPYELPSIYEEGRGIIQIADERDELFEEAARIIVRYKQGSTSLLQRKLKIGYARAARIIDELQSAGIVGPPTEGNKAREVLIESELELEQILESLRRT
jgi:S-DNA-T family DNA segregation ATPase FtsK/SpoIIIE